MSALTGAICPGSMESSFFRRRIHGRKSKWIYSFVPPEVQASTTFVVAVHSAVDHAGVARPSIATEYITGKGEAIIFYQEVGWERQMMIRMLVNGKAVLGKVYYLGLERTPNGGIRIVWKERKLGAL